MTTVRIITFGCKVNQCDGEGMARQCGARGYEVVSGWDADAFIVNTCTVTSTADAKARKLIHRIAREHPEALLLVTGCYADRDPEALAAIPGVDAVVGNGRKGEVGEVIARLRPAKESGGHASGTPTTHSAGWEPIRQAQGRPAPRLGRVRGFVKVQDGCDHRCTYCVVPAVRGRPASKPMEEVLQEIQALAAAGTPEVVLCGVRLGAYGREHENASLASLLHALRGVEIPRVRLSSLEPMDVGDDLVAEIANHPRLCHHLHLPLQSGDDGVLAEMGRGYTSGEFAALIRKLRGVWPEVAIGADVIVGFPGETQEQFERTVSFVRAIGCSRLHVFPFSARPGTPAAERRDQVAAPERRARAERMLAVGEELAQEAAVGWVGREVKVLIEERGRDGVLTGWTEQYVRARCQGPEEWIGRVIEITASEARGGALVGEQSRRRRLAEEAAKLDLAEERALAEEGMGADEWPAC